MHTKIIEEVMTFAEPKFADWIRPFLSLENNKTDFLIGVRTPILRKLAKKYCNISHKTLNKLLTNKYHEIRALALFIMVIKSKKEPEKMCELYLKNHKHINNWDLIDYTCPHIIAPIISKEELIKLSDSDFLWENRTAMVSTIYYIKKNDFSLALNFAEKYIKHPHHLMHKAAGWMLREIGKKDLDTLINFLNKFSDTMPAIMKSYAREHLR